MVDQKLSGFALAPRRIVAVVDVDLFDFLEQFVQVQSGFTRESRWLSELAAGHLGRSAETSRRSTHMKMVPCRSPNVSGRMDGIWDGSVQKGQHE